VYKALVISTPKEIVIEESKKLLQLGKGKHKKKNIKKTKKKCNYKTKGTVKYVVC
jgi:hypothetical protein